MASDQRLAWVVVTVSVWIAMGALTRYSDANPFVGSLVRLVYAAPLENVWPAAILNPSFVITRSLAAVVAKVVEMVAVVVAAPMRVVPVRSRGAAATTPLHSGIWGTTGFDAGGTVRVGGAVPPGVVGEYPVRAPPSPA